MKKQYRILTPLLHHQTLRIILLGILLITNYSVTQDRAAVNNGYSLHRPGTMHSDAEGVFIMDRTNELFLHHIAQTKQRIPQQQMNISYLPGGEYTVGSGGYFETIDDAFEYLSEKAIKGPITLLLIDELYLASEERGGTFTLAGPIIGASSTNTITIRPAHNTNVTIKGNGEAVLLFKDVSFLTLDGVGPLETGSLIVHADRDTSVIQNIAIAFIGNCDFCTIQRLTASTDDVAAAATIIMCSDSAASPDQCLILGNHIASGNLGIFLDGYSNNINRLTKPTGNIIRANTIGSPTEDKIAWGIQVQFTEGTIIENNDVENLRLEYQGTQIGINTYWGFNTIIRNNTVHNIIHSKSTGNVYGILASGANREIGSNVRMYNNKVFGFNTKSFSESGVFGLRGWNQNDLHVDFNTVAFSNEDNTAPMRGSAAAYFDASNLRTTVRNNILTNVRDDSPNLSYALFFSTMGGFSDCNNLAVSSGINAYLASNGIDYKNLAGWQSQGFDANSISVQPCFRCAHIHIDTLEPAMEALSGKAVPIAGIYYDYDGVKRDKDFPDIGADEFEIENPNGVTQDPMAVPGSCALLQNFPNPFNPTTTIRYALPAAAHVTLTVYDLLGREQAQLVNSEQSAGWKTVEWNAVNASSGIYFYKLVAGNFTEIKKMMLIR